MSVNDIKIYIIIPIYNAEKYLNQCLESILTQTYHNFICVMVNDGSTDSSLQICQNYIKDNRFVLISQENKGVSKTRNESIKKANGDYIMFIDNDDFLDFIDSTLYKDEGEE